MFASGSQRCVPHVFLIPQFLQVADVMKHGVLFISNLRKVATDSILHHIASISYALKRWSYTTMFASSEHRPVCHFLFCCALQMAPGTWICAAAYRRVYKASSFLESLQCITLILISSHKSEVNFRWLAPWKRPRKSSACPPLPCTLELARRHDDELRLHREL